MKTINLLLCTLFTIRHVVVLAVPRCTCASLANVSDLTQAVLCEHFNSNECFDSVNKTCTAAESLFACEVHSVGGALGKGNGLQPTSASNPKDNTAELVGIAVAATFGAVAVIGTGIFIRSKKQQRTNQEQKVADDITSSVLAPSSLGGLDQIAISMNLKPLSLEPPPGLGFAHDNPLFSGAKAGHGQQKHKSNTSQSSRSSNNSATELFQPLPRYPKLTTFNTLDEALDIEQAQDEANIDASTR